MKDLQINLLSEEQLNTYQQKDNFNYEEFQQQQSRSYIKNYLIKHLSYSIHLDNFMKKHLDGNRSMSIGRALIYILYYITRTLFFFKRPIELICRYLSPQNKFAKYVSQQISVFLPLICFSYFYVFIFSAQNISELPILNCVQISIGIFLIEAIFLRQQIKIIRLLLLTYVLYISLNLISTSGLSTIGLFCNLFLRMRYGTSYQKYLQIRHVIFAIIILIFSLIRLLSFDVNSALIDSIMALIILKNNHIKKYNKICFFILILAQYLHNFSFPDVDDVGSYLVYGCSTFLLVIIIELYKSIGLNLSFNKLFVINISFGFFLNILSNIKQSSSIIDQFIYFLIFYISQILIAVLTENNQCISFNSCIFSFNNQSVNQLLTKTQNEKSFQEEEDILNENKILNSDLELQDKQYLKSLKTNCVKLKQHSQNEDNQSQNAEKSYFQTRSILTDENQMDNISSEKRLSEQLSIKNVKDHTIQDEMQRNRENNKEINTQMFINKHVNFQSFKSCYCNLNIQNLISYTIIGVLLLIFTLTKFYWIMQNLQHHKSTKISQYKGGLIYYSISQSMLIAILCIFISNKMIKPEFKTIQIPNNVVQTIQNQNNQQIINNVYRQSQQCFLNPNRNECVIL